MWGIYFFIFASCEPLNVIFFFFQIKYSKTRNVFELKISHFWKETIVLQHEILANLHNIPSLKGFVGSGNIFDNFATQLDTWNFKNAHKCFWLYSISKKIWPLKKLSYSTCLINPDFYFFFFFFLNFFLWESPTPFW